MSILEPRPCTRKTQQPVYSLQLYIHVVEVSITSIFLPFEYLAPKDARNLVSFLVVVLADALTFILVPLSNTEALGVFRFLSYCMADCAIQFQNKNKKLFIEELFLTVRSMAIITA